jgi:hypothetical protein
MTLRSIATRVLKEIEQDVHDVMDFFKVEKAQL